MANEDFEGQLLRIKNELLTVRLYLQGQAKTRPENYTDAVIAHFVNGIGQPMYEHYLKYALGSLDRGRALVKKYRTEVSNSDSYLDVGSGWGGSTIAMAEAGISRAVGFEIEQKYVDIAKINARDEGLSDHVQFFNMDVTDTEAIAEFEPFDFMTCLDVIEHVLDPDLCIKNFGKLSAPGGTIVLHVPNYRSVGAIEKDPHHHLFGSSLLSRSDAIRAHHEEFPGNKVYTVGYFHILEWYRKRMEAAGFTVTLFNDVSKSETAWPGLLAKQDGFLDVLQTKATELGWSQWRKDMIEGALAAQNKQLHKDIDSGVSVLDLYIRYGLPAFHLRLQKEGIKNKPES